VVPKSQQSSLEHNPVPGGISMTQSAPAINDPLDAFCKDTQAYLDGAAGGPLSGLTFAAKDIFDVAGHVTGGGNPDWKATHQPASETAWVVQTLVNAGATMIGKTHTDELTRGILGENSHYGTPINPKAPGRVPGGSSSGSAAAVAGELVDFALGSDTGGSVRIPASFCGLYGLRPTHGRIPREGLLEQAPSYDTIGWFARDAETFARVGSVIFQVPVPAGRPSKLMIAEDVFEAAEGAVADALRPAVDRISALVASSSPVRLSPAGLDPWAQQQDTLQSREAWEMLRDWIDEVNPRFSYQVGERYNLASSITNAQVEQAAVVRDSVRARMDEVFSDGGFVCLPTSPVPAPPRGQSLSERRGGQSRILRFTCMGGTTGRPQITIPVAEVYGLPVGLSFMGNRGADEALMGFALEVASALAA
jgi:amidase